MVIPLSSSNIVGRFLNKMSWPSLLISSRKGIINWIVNLTYIALIAKKDKSNKAIDYRPIFTTALRQLMVKTMAERPKETLPYTIFLLSNGFCERQTNYK